MKYVFLILSALLCFDFATNHCFAQSNNLHLHFDFCDDTLDIKTDSSVVVNFNDALDETSVESFYSSIKNSNYQPIIDSILAYKKRNNLNDWLYYQLIRKTAQQLSPKANNYYRYTLYKWFLLSKSGYDATLGIGPNELLFYVHSEDSIYDIPAFYKNGNQYVCLNYHDYGKIDFDNDTIKEIAVHVPEAQKTFSYTITNLPDFKSSDYAEKEVQFNFHNKIYRFKILMNPQVQAMFTNYPVVDFASYFNIPMSNKTYSSLIPLLKKNISGMSQKNGIDYLMRFTRNAFLYESDQENFGKEKRLSPEQTLMYEYSDCDDRSALFFYLVKEIYNLPMIAIMYPTHITMAVQLNKPVGKPIVYNNKKYSVCEPTPQLKDLHVGEISPSLRNENYQVVYEYNPLIK